MLVMLRKAIGRSWRSAETEAKNWSEGSKDRPLKRDLRIRIGATGDGVEAPTEGSCIAVKKGLDDGEALGNDRCSRCLSSLLLSDEVGFAIDGKGAGYGAILFEGSNVSDWGIDDSKNVENESDMTSRTGCRRGCQLVRIKNENTVAYGSAL